MPNRYQSKARQDIYDTIARYEGEYCLACFVEGAGKRRPPSVNLEIDHAGAERHLLCKTHNLYFRSLSLDKHISVLAAYSAENVSARIKKGELTNRVTDTIDYANGSIEMQASKKILDNWLTFMNEYLQDNKYITKDDAVYAGAYESGGNASTIYRLVKTYSRFNGPFMELSQNGEKVIMLRPDFTSKKTDHNHNKVFNPTRNNGHNGNGAH
jgi:hypothetical protein